MTDPTTPPATPPTTRHTVVVPNSINMVSLLGPRDSHLAMIEQSFGADVHVRGNRITLEGDPGEIALAERLLDELVTIIRTGQGISPETVERAVAMLRAETTERPADVLSLNILSSRGRSIRPKTLNQKRYVDAIDKHTITFGIGPAGTGKTYLAMAKAVQALQSKQVNRIILTRPAVEAGEHLGYLPGTLSEKIDPYLRPLYDALHDMIDPESIPKLLAAGTIEVAPLAYMRGRAQPLDAQVLTPTGFRDMGSLQVGDLVVGSDGLPTPVIGVYPQGEKDVYRVIAHDGASTVCCGEHLWTVRTDGRRQTLETTDIAVRLGLDDGHRFELPTMGPVELAPLADHRILVEPGGRRTVGVSPTPGSPPQARRSSELGETGRLARSWGGAVTPTVTPTGAGLRIELRGPRSIDRIEPAGRAETRCIAVAAEDSLYVTDDFLVTHNTLNDSYIILDEAQNTTPEQMKMFLTRLGFGSKIVVTGDITQVDLPGSTKSGLRIIEGILDDVTDIAFCRLTSHDVVRHKLVGKIVAAYEEFDARGGLRGIDDSGQRR